MKTITKFAAGAALAAALALPMATPSQAGWHHHGGRGAAAAIGFGAGAIIGAAAANAAAGPTYYDSGYDSYAYEPGYAYEPAPAYSYGYRSGYNDSNVREHRCMLSPGSVNYVPCDNKF